MITQKATEFFVNGHQCLIKYESREHYSGWIDGEKIDTGPTHYLRDELIADAKWRPEVEPEFWKVCRAVDNFVRQQCDRKGNHLWVHRDTIISHVTPLESVGVAYQATLELMSLDLFERGEIVMDRNVEEMFKALPYEETDAEIDESITNPWNKYKSE